MRDSTGPLTNNNPEVSRTVNSKNENSFSDQSIILVVAVEISLRCSSSNNNNKSARSLIKFFFLSTEQKRRRITGPGLEGGQPVGCVEIPDI